MLADYLLLFVLLCAPSLKVRWRVGRGEVLMGATEQLWQWVTSVSLADREKIRPSEMKASLGQFSRLSLFPSSSLSWLKPQTGEQEGTNDCLDWLFLSDHMSICLFFLLMFEDIIYNVCKISRKSSFHLKTYLKAYFVFITQSQNLIHK